MASIGDNKVTLRLRWFEHVRRTPIEAPLRRVDRMKDRPIIRGRGRPKTTLGETIRNDLDLYVLLEDLVLIHVSM